MKELKTDIVVVSAGTAGLAAAVAAAEGKVKVTEFEKSGHTGGTANLGSGPFAVESKLQMLMQMTFTVDEAYKYFMDQVRWGVNGRLVRTFFDRSGDTITWLEKQGVGFTHVSSHNPGYLRTMHVVDGPSPGPGQIGSAAKMMTIMAQKARELGVDLHLKTPVIKLIKERKRISGVIAQDESGEEIKVKSGAVILATGGYGGGFRGIPGIIGDGIRMASEVGADTRETNEKTDMPPMGGGSGSGRRGGPIFFYTLQFAFQQVHMTVNLFGERFINEEYMVTNPYATNAASAQKDGITFTIFDENTKNLFIEKGFDFASAGRQVPITDAKNFDSEFKQMEEQGSDRIFKVNSLEELSAKTGIELSNLKRNIAEYNKICETGRDLIFNKKPRYLRPVVKPPFYVSKGGGMPRRERAWEGIRINHNMEVLTKDYEVIPGLYATGMDAAFNMWDGPYPISIPGTAMGFALNSGRIAGEQALTYLKTIKKK